MRSERLVTCLAVKLTRRAFTALTAGAAGWPADAGTASTPYCLRHPKSLAFSADLGLLLVVGLEQTPVRIKVIENGAFLPAREMR